MNKDKISKVFLVWIAVTGIGVGVLLPNLVLANSCSKDGAKELLKICKNFVRIEGPIIEPSAECCDAVRKADIPCSCNFVTPNVEKIISVKKAVAVAGKCGRPFTPKTNCGSYIIPMANLY